MTQPYGQQPQEPGSGQPSNPQEPYSAQHGQPAPGQSSYSQGQSGYGQSGYGQSGYGQSGYGQQNQPGYPPQGQTGYGQQNYGPSNPNYGAQGYPPATATTKGRPNIGALILAVIAAVLGILSLFVLAWYRDNYGSVSGGGNTANSSKFSKIHDVLNTAQNQIDANPSAGKYIHFGIAPTYFGWLGYLLIAAAVVLAIIAALPTGGAVMLFKILTAIVSLAGIGLTLWAIDLVSFDAALRSQLGSDAPSGYGDWLKHTSFGAWAMGLAFLLCLIAALIPPKRVAVVNQPAESGRY
jgi:hypothetical protein